MSIVTEKIIIDGTDATALSVSGGIGVSGNVNSGDIISGQTISTTSSISAIVVNPTDAVNTGTIDQVSTELTLFGSGNKVALSTGNSLVFKNDNSNQLTAYSGRHKIDPSEIHGFLQNRTIIKQTCSLQNPNLSLVGVGSGGNMLFYNLGILRKDQVIKGVFFWVDVARASGSHFGLYPQTNPTLVVSTPSNSAIVAGINYIDFSTPYTIPTTQVYFLGTLIGGASGVNGVSLNSNVYLNFGRTASTGALTANTQYSNLLFSTLPSTLSGIAFTTSTSNVFVGIYG